MLVGSRAFKNTADVWQQALAGFNGLAAFSPKPVTAEPEAIPKGRSGLMAGWEASGRKGINPNPQCQIWG